MRWLKKKMKSRIQNLFNIGIIWLWHSCSKLVRTLVDIHRLAHTDETFKYHRYLKLYQMYILRDTLQWSTLHLSTQYFLWTINWRHTAMDTSNTRFFSPRKCHLSTLCSNWQFQSGSVAFNSGPWDVHLTGMSMEYGSKILVWLFVLVYLAFCIFSNFFSLPWYSFVGVGISPLPPSLSHPHSSLLCCLLPYYYNYYNILLFKCVMVL